jgi:uncharacterized protein YbcC (UPF0753/DUF2309 family)
MGVIEGNGGLLRSGIPWQSIHDGERFIHDPLRMSVVVEAPREAISTLQENHAEVRKLCDNRWLHLFALDDAGRLAWRYDGKGGWVAEGEQLGLSPEAEPTPARGQSVSAG